MTFPKDNIWYEYDVFSKSKHVIILSFRLNIAAATNMHTILFCLFRFIQLRNKMICISKNQLIKITGLLNGAVKKTTAPESLYFL